MTIEKAGEKIVRLLTKEGKQAFFVGGFVRNMILKRDSDNVDIATDATPDEVEKILNKAKITNKPVGKKFGSILAIVDGFKVELTTFRAEGRYSDNRHPDQVRFIKDYLDDAKRRDFTVNAIYFDPILKELFDPTNGMKDLRANLLRFVGDPRKRIDEDALRMLRGVRLATQLGFKLEGNSFAAIKTRAKYIQGISGERVKAELDKILLSENRVEGIKLLDKIGLLRFIIPEFEKLKRVRHNSKVQHLEGDMLTHTLNAVGLLEKNCDLSLVYATLFHDIGKIIKPVEIIDKENGERRLSYRGHIKLSGEIFMEYASKYKFLRKDRDLIYALVNRHDDRTTKFKDRPLEHQIKYLFWPNMELLLDLWRVDSLANLRLLDGKLVNQVSPVYTAAISYMKDIKKSKPILEKFAKGELIMKYTKLKPGPALGRRIEDVKVQIVLGKIQNETDLKKFLQ